MKKTSAIFIGALTALLLANAISASSQTTPVVAPASTPSPKPKPTPSPFSYSGYVRAFQFNRQNASNNPAGRGQINQQSINYAGKLHADYNFAGTPFTVGASYVGADPLDANGPCSQIGSYGAGGACHQYPSSNTRYKQSDTTLPGFGLSSLAEAYLQYKAHGLYVKAGDQMFNSPWAGPSDSRVKAAYYEGADAKYTFAPGWTIEAADMIDWESRTSSDFNQSTLLTINSNGTFKRSSGFLLGNVAYAQGSMLTADANMYAFNNIANMIWVEGKWYPYAKAASKPFLAVQFADENNTGTALVGKVDATLFGAQIGTNVGKNVVLALGYDDSPAHSQLMTLPTGTTCSAAKHVITGSTGYFMPTGGTPNCVPGAVAGTATIYYGGIASPYSDSYATDPAFTTSISQGMIDRRSPGSSFKLAATIQTNDKRFKFILSQAYYNYGNAAGSAMTDETNLDGTFFFNKVTSGAYHGLSLRERYAEREISNTALYGGLPIFKYNRVQLEYDF